MAGGHTGAHFPAGIEVKFRPNHSPTLVSILVPSSNVPLVGRAAIATATSP